MQSVYQPERMRSHVPRAREQEVNRLHAYSKADLLVPGDLSPVYAHVCVSVLFIFHRWRSGGCAHLLPDREHSFHLWCWGGKGFHDTLGDGAGKRWPPRSGFLFIHFYLFLSLKWPCSKKIHCLRCEAFLTSSWWALFSMFSGARCGNVWFCSCHIAILFGCLFHGKKKINLAESTSKSDAILKTHESSIKHLLNLKAIRFRAKLHFFKTFFNEKSELEWKKRLLHHHVHRPMRF